MTNTKKSQISIFLILGVVIALLSAILIFSSESVKREKTFSIGNSQISEAKLYFNSCLENSFLRAKNKFGIDKGNSKQFSNFIDGQMLQCIKENPLDNVELKRNPKSTVTYSNDAVIVTTEMPVALTSLNKEISFDKLTYSYKIRERALLPLGQENTLMSEVLLEHSAGIKLAIPKDTKIEFNSDKKNLIEVKLKSPESINVPLANMVGNTVFELSPDITFDREAVIYIDYSSWNVPKDADQSNLGIYSFDELSNNWIRLENSEVDTKNKVVIGKTTHFSVYALGEGMPQSYSCNVQERIDYLCGKCNKGKEDNKKGPYNPLYPQCGSVWNINEAELNALIKARNNDIKKISDAKKMHDEIKMEQCRCEDFNSYMLPEFYTEIIKDNKDGKIEEKLEEEPKEDKTEVKVNGEGQNQDCGIQERIDYLCGKCNMDKEDNQKGPHNPLYPKCGSVWGINEKELSALINARANRITTTGNAKNYYSEIRLGACKCEENFEESREVSKDNEKAVGVELEDEIDAIISEHKALNPDGVLSLVITDLDSGATIEYNQKQKVVAASTIKLIVLLSILKEVENENIPLKDVDWDLTEMIRVSDNYATARLIDKVGFEKLQMNMIEWGAKDSEFNSWMYGTKSTRRKDSPNFINAEDANTILLALVNGYILSERYAKIAIDKLSNIDSSQNYIIPRFLPKNMVVVSHKVGFIPKDSFKDVAGDVQNDLGIVFVNNKPRFTVVFLSQNNEFHNGAAITGAKVSRAAYDAFVGIV